MSPSRRRHASPAASIRGPARGSCRQGRDAARAARSTSKESGRARGRAGSEWPAGWRRSRRLGSTSQRALVGRISRFPPISETLAPSEVVKGSSAPKAPARIRPCDPTGSDPAPRASGGATVPRAFAGPIGALVSGAVVQRAWPAPPPSCPSESPANRNGRPDISRCRRCSPRLGASGAGAPGTTAP